MSSRQRQLEAVRAAAERRLDFVVDLATQICTIPAPTGAEFDRARLVASILESLNYSATVDDIGNVYSVRGSGDDPGVMLAAHTDTVFPAGTPIEVRREGHRLSAPGIGDNSLGVASMIGALAILDDLDIATDVPIHAVATVGEEGLGNLAGVRRAVDELAPQLGAVVAVEGHNLGRVTHAAVGSVRWRVSVDGPGGHSWGAFGKPSAIHGLGRIISAISALRVPADPKTTFNVGLVEGGTSVNTIAARASALVDMRSVDAEALGRLVEQVREIVEASAGDGLSTTIELLGERPAGSIPLDSPLVVAAGAILTELGMTPVYDASSTDANIPISKGIPAICIGMTHGTQGHTTSESIDIDPIVDGLTQLCLLCINATAITASGQAS